MQYEEANAKGDFDEFSFTCAEEARPEFYSALQGLRVFVVEMCELPGEYANRIDIRGVSVSYGGDKQVMGATISSSMALARSNCGLNLNTPHKAEESYSDTPAQEEALLSEECVEALHELYEQCVQYIRGYRAQQDLFMPETDKEETEEEVAA